VEDCLCQLDFSETHLPLVVVYVFYSYIFLSFLLAQQIHVFILKCCFR